MARQKIQDAWKAKAFMKDLPEYKGEVLDVGSGDLRCPYCGRLIFKGSLGPGSKIEVKCSRRECGKTFPVNKL